MSDEITAAVDVLYRHRHALPNDVLRSLQSIWACASAARFGEPYERFWIGLEDSIREHNTAECEEPDLEQCDSCLRRLPRGQIHHLDLDRWWCDDCAFNPDTGEPYIEPTERTST
jgi:hypothetical protein